MQVVITISPRDYYAVLFDLDGVLSRTATVHASAWKSCSKQADVLMLFYLFSADEIGELFERLGCLFEYETIPRNVAYYTARSCHGPMLCRVVFAWADSRIGVVRRRRKL